MVDLHFSVKAWSAWSDSRPGKAGWQQWARQGKICTGQAEPDVSWMPAMQRRRLSRLSKIVFTVVRDCLGDELGAEAQQPLCIFCSRHGELNRTLKIIRSVAAGEDVSPTDFSMSVHSTALGLFSIFTGNRQPSSMVVAGEDTFAAALLEAYAYLQRFPARPVLLVYADEPVPEPLVSDDGLPHESIAVAMLLQNTRQARPSSAVPGFTLRRAANGSGVSQTETLAEAFLSFWLGEQTELVLSTRHSRWHWVKT